MVVSLDAELVLDAAAAVGEGPVWDGRAGLLWWVDIEGRSVHRFDPDTGSDRAFATPSMVGAVAARAGGGLLLALADRLALVDAPAVADAFRSPATLVAFKDGPGIRSNDGRCDPDGRFLVGRMALDERPVGRLVSVGSAGPRSLLDGLRIPNGLAWSADGGTMYFIDSPSRRLDAYDYEPATGDISAQRVHRAFDDQPGVPDGMTIDAEGGLWLAFWGGSSVRRFAADGALELVVRLPVSQVTSCTFGGRDLTDLYITTAARGVDEPHAGGLFRVRPGVRGVDAVAWPG